MYGISGLYAYYRSYMLQTAFRAFFSLPEDELAVSELHAVLSLVGKAEVYVSGEPYHFGRIRNALYSSMNITEFK